MVTTVYAGLLGLIYLALSIFVIMGRWKYRVNMGDGGSENLLKRIRLHGNFIEYVPLALILMFLSEQEDASEMTIHILGMALVIGRIMHPIGLYNKFGASIGRSGGMFLTFAVIFTASLICIKSFFFY